MSSQRGWKKENAVGSQQIPRVQSLNEGCVRLALPALLQAAVGLNPGPSAPSPTWGPAAGLAAPLGSKATQTLEPPRPRLVIGILLPCGLT
eukprot:scaffold77117_cov22-Prasinocladus_malaysianus.AAC.1